VASSALLTNSLRGASHPRLEVAPPYDASYGHIAAKLMRAAGKPLDPWQEDSCELMLAVDEYRNWTCEDYAEWVARQNGKGAILEARALTGFLIFDGRNGMPRENLIAWSAHEYKTAMEAFRRVNSLLRALGTVISPNLIEIPTPTGSFRIKVSNTNGDESFERLDTEQRIKFIARSKGSGRGFTGDCQIVDESFAYTALQQDALAPTGLAVANAQTVYMSTPPLAGDTAEPMYSLRKRAEAGGDSTIGYRDWGIGGWLEEINPSIASLRGVPPVDIDDRRLWAASCPAWGSRITEHKLVAIRRKLGPAGFAREVLGMWPTEIAAEERADVIPADQWDALADPKSQIDGACVFSLDMPWNRTSVVIASGGIRTDGKRHVEIIQQRLGSAWVIEYLRDILDKWRPAAVLVDAGGPIASMLPDIERECEDSGTDLVRIGGTEMPRACGAFFSDATEDNMRHLGQPVLGTALKDAVPNERGDVWIWDRRDSTSDISPLVAATLAVYGATAYADGGAPHIW
jgi:hypothetical protein